MSAPMTVSQYEAQEVSELIDELIASGDIDAVESADSDVVLECARRYVFKAIAQRQRAQSRNRERYEKVREEANAKLRAKARMIVDDLARELHREWSVSMLGSTFSLPNGVQVSWADASVAQHEARASQLEGLAAGDLQTASIHRQAVADILAAGVSRLGDL